MPRVSRSAPAVPTSAPMSPDDLHALLVRRFEQAVEQDQGPGARARRDRDYYDGKQWTAAEEAELTSRGQAPIVVNRIKPKIDALLGLERRSRTDPKCLPRTPADADAARAATHAIRFVLDANRFDRVRSEVYEHLLIEGTGACEITVVPTTHADPTPAPDLRVPDSTGTDSGGLKRASDGQTATLLDPISAPPQAAGPKRASHIPTATSPDPEFAPPQVAQVVVRIVAVPWERLFLDPHARRRDLTDARYRGQVIWLDLDAAKARFPGRDEILDGALSEATRDRERHGPDAPLSPWADGDKKRVRVVEMWYRAPGRAGAGAGAETVMRALFCRGGMLEGPTESPYGDEDGNRVDPYVFAAAHVARSGERYGVVRQQVPIQDEYNKRRSKALHLLSVRQVRAEKGAVESVAHARREMARPDGYIETVPGMAFEILPTGDMAQAQFALLGAAERELDAVGPDPALAGKVGEGASGRAIQVRQAGARLEMGPVTDTLIQWQEAVYRAVWQRVRTYWTGPRWIRVSDDLQSLHWVGLNRPITRGEALVARFGQIPAGLVGDPALDEVISVENRPAAMDVDIVVGQAPDTVTLRQEQFATLVDLARGGIPIPPEVLIEASDLPAKERILDALARNREGTL